MIAGLVTQKHMSDAGLGASVKLITHLRSCLHLGVMPVGTCLLFQFSCSCLVLTWSAQSAHVSRHRQRTLLLCGNIQEFDLSRLRLLRHPRSGKFQVKLILLDPLQNLEDPPVPATLG